MVGPTNSDGCRPPQPIRDPQGRNPGSGLFRATAGGRFFWAKLLTPTVSLASSSTGTPFARACSRGKTACARKSTRLVSLLLQLLQRYLQHLLFLVLRQLGEQERNL